MKHWFKLVIDAQVVATRSTARSLYYIAKEFLIDHGDTAMVTYQGMTAAFLRNEDGVITAVTTAEPM
jgi:hypothetical protein